MISTHPADDDAKAYVEGVTCMWVAAQNFGLLQRVVPPTSLGPCLWVSAFNGRQEHDTFGYLPQTSVRPTFVLSFRF